MAALPTTISITPTVNVADLLAQDLPTCKMVSISQPWNYSPEQWHVLSQLLARLPETTIVRYVLLPDPNNSAELVRDMAAAGTDCDQCLRKASILEWHLSSLSDESLDRAIVGLPCFRGPVVPECHVNLPGTTDPHLSGDKIRAFFAMIGTLPGLGKASLDFPSNGQLCQLPSKTLQALFLSSTLSEVKVRNCRITRGAVEDLAHAIREEDVTLHTLHLDSIDKMWMIDLWGALSRNRTIRCAHFVTAGTDLAMQQDLEHLFEANNTIQDFRLEENDLHGNSVFSALAFLRNNRSLKKLGLPCMFFDHSSALWPSLRKNTNLEDLDIGLEIDDFVMSVLADVFAEGSRCGLKRLQLKILVFDGNFLGDDLDRFEQGVRNSGTTEEIDLIAERFITELASAMNQKACKIGNLELSWVGRIGGEERLSVLTPRIRDVSGLGKLRDLMRPKLRALPGISKENPIKKLNLNCLPVPGMSSVTATDFRGTAKGVLQHIEMFNRLHQVDVRNSITSGLVLAAKVYDARDNFDLVFVLLHGNPEAMKPDDIDPFTLIAEDLKKDFEKLAGEMGNLPNGSSSIEQVHQRLEKLKIYKKVELENNLSQQEIAFENKLSQHKIEHGKEINAFENKLSQQQMEHGKEINALQIKHAKKIKHLAVVIFVALLIAAIITK